MKKPKIYRKLLTKKQKRRNRKRAIREMRDAKETYNSGCFLCDLWLASPYYPGVSKKAMHKIHGPLCPKYRKPKEREPPNRIEPPDVGKLANFDVRRVEKGLRKMLAVTPTREYPPMPANPLRSFRPRDVFVWAETWRDLYAERGQFVTVQALHNLILHSELPFADQEDAHATLTALYSEESSREAAEGRLVLLKMQEEKAAAAEAEAQMKRDLARQQRITAKWGVPVELIARRPKIYGQPASLVIRKMGADGYTFRECRRVLKRLSLKRIAKSYTLSKWREGRMEETAAFLTTQQNERLYQIATQ